MRPRIGITTSSVDRAPEGAIQPSAATHLAYARQIRNAGGLPFLLPNVLTEMDITDLIASLDGLLLSGGGDIDPVYWHEPPHPAITLVDPARDAFELALARAALSEDLPVLGICRGVQVLAVATGGDLWQDIPSQCAHFLQHRQTVPRQLPSHDVTVIPDSLLAGVLWPHGSDHGRLSVNSFHHQAPRNCGTLLSVVATSPDGSIEALALPGAHFALGVQWHPEDMADSDPRQARIFSALVAAAHERHVTDCP